MTQLKIKHIDAFTRTPFTGNFAGVVPAASGLTDEQMQLIAREKNVSETAFVLPASVPGADLHIRWFTPGEEVPLCGHATIATFHALAEAGLYGMTNDGVFPFKIQTRKGILNVTVTKNGGLAEVEFELPLPNFQNANFLSESMLESLGIGSWDIEQILPSVVDSYLYVPLKFLEKLRGLRPNYFLLSNACRSAKVLGVCLFTLQTIDERSAVHSRFFAPGLGVNEDPVTGSANGPLGVYLHNYAIRSGFVPAGQPLADGRHEYIGEQGDEVGRPGRVRIRLQTEGEQVRRVWIAGEAVTIMDSTLNI